MPWSEESEYTKTYSNINMGVLHGRHIVAAENVVWYSVHFAYDGKRTVASICLVDKYSLVEQNSEGLAALHADGPC